MRISLKGCRLLIDGKVISKKAEEIIQIASDLDLGIVHPKIDCLDLEEEELEGLESFLSNEIFVEGICLEGDEDDESE